MSEEIDPDLPRESSPVSSRSSSTTKELGPVKTGRETPLEGPPIPSSAEELTADGTQIEMKKKDPLPPIGTKTEDGNGVRSPSESSLGKSESQQSIGSRRPAILAYRRETPEDERESILSTTSSTRRKPSVTTFKEPPSSQTVECQTEWSWLEDMRMLQRSQHKSRGSAKSIITSLAKAGIRSKRAKKSLQTATGSVRSTIPDEESELDVEIEVQKGPSSSSLSIGGRSHKSGSVASVLESVITGHESEQSIPYPCKEDEYGIPILHLDSDSETSDEDSLYQYQYQPGEIDELDDPDTLPSIGPPEILKYQPESSKQDVDLGDPPVTPQQPVDDTTGMQAKMAELESGAFEGKCEFCSQKIKPFPSLDDQKLRPPAELYCCDEYREFVQFMLTHPLHDEHKKDKKIDIKPHPPYGSKQARRDAKERAAQRMRERELARQQAAIQAGIGGATQMSSGTQNNFYQFARQMKTINYQLSSQKCLEEGWTLRPPSPLLSVMDDQDVFEPEPMLPPWAETEGKAGRGRKLILKFYEDGNKFIIFFPDGTGNLFYPSGRVAVSITSVDQGLYSYIIHEDTESGTVLGLFEPNGCAVTYYNTGGIRVYLDQICGMELDPKGARKRKWTWKDQIQHVHAPPIQPLTFAITPQVGVRIMGQDNITLTFAAKKRSCRFQVGTKLKLVAPENLPPREMDEDELFRTDCQTRIESLLLKVNNLLRFPNSPKLDKIPVPPYIATKQQKIEKFKGVRSARPRSKKAPDEESELSASTPVITVN